MSKYFDQVIAIDISDSLLAHAKAQENVEFRTAPAEESGITASSIDLVTVAQAIHWFEFETFWNEVERVLKSNGILAYWGYVWPVVDERVDSLLDQFKENIVGFWPEMSRYLHDGYVELDAPLKRIESPDFGLTENWSSS